MLRQVNERSGVGLTFVGRAAAGEVGAGFVRWPDGRDGVLTRGFGSLDDLRRTARVLDAARSGGLPVPQYQLLTEVMDGVAVVQERLPGWPPEVVDRALLEAMIALTDRFAGLGADLPVPSMYLLESGPGFCLHESLLRYDGRTRRLLDWVREVGRDEPSGMTGDDLVHLDFHTGNVLVDEAGELTGIVDWDGIGRGDRLFGLVTLRFDAESRLRFDADTRPPLDPTAPQLDAETRPPLDAELGWFDELLEGVLEPGVLRLYWAHMSLRLVDWSIRHHGPADTARWLDFAETRMS
ncbi:aminoglycoside phosphotransferase family protein [Kribbella jiaozuonensis]|uniref:Aminoglycoside phosphotransferase family protein n=1 Tax=Kribbella jiaozuonensis TaxID=2575441 RepID=A0A4U3LKL1_9ACTN|nr:aminoglycoside phosphotransferase family protein [Kribbella jiaozuonensis]